MSDRTTSHSQDDEDNNTNAMKPSSLSVGSSSYMNMSSVSLGSLKGLRDSQEDRHDFIAELTHHPFVTGLCVYDGHGGDGCAEFCLKNVMTRLDSVLDDDGGVTDDVIIELFLKLDEEWLDYASSVNRDFPDDSGCCVAIVLLNSRNGEMTVINIGDSRVMVSRDKRANVLSTLHTPTNAEERSRIEKTTFMVMRGRVNGMLGISRAMGDLYCKRPDDSPEDTNRDPRSKAVCAVPAVRRYYLTENDEFVLVACDGLFETLTPQEVTDWVWETRRLEENREPLDVVATILSPRGNTSFQAKKSVIRSIALEGPSMSSHEKGLAVRLASHAIRKGSKDNVSVILAFFHDNDEVVAQEEERQEREEEETPTVEDAPRPQSTSESPTREQDNA